MRPLLRRLADVRTPPVLRGDYEMPRGISLPLITICIVRRNSVMEMPVLMKTGVPTRNRVARLRGYSDDPATESFSHQIDVGELTLTPIRTILLTPLCSPKGVRKGESDLGAAHGAFPRLEQVRAVHD